MKLKNITVVDNRKKIWHSLCKRLEHPSWNQYWNHLGSSLTKQLHGKEKKLETELLHQLWFRLTNKKRDTK